MIKKHGDKFVVTNKAGTKVLGTHPSKEKAQKQLAAIEISKAKHMHEDTKRFKDFRNTLTESEYKETLTGYPNRGIPTSSGPINFGPEKLAHINAMLNAISRSTFFSPNEAFIRIKTRLNLLMLDFPWTPYLWGGTGQVPPAAPGTPSGSLGVVPITVTLFGRVDGIDGDTGNVVTNGRANPTGGLQEFTLLASIEIAEDGLYRVNAKLMPKADVVVAEEGVEVDGDTIEEEKDNGLRTMFHHPKGKAVVNKSGKVIKIYRTERAARKHAITGKPVNEETELDEMAQTYAREREMERKGDILKAKAQRAYDRKMHSNNPRVAKKAERDEKKHDAAYDRLAKQDEEEFNSPKLYGKGGKIVKNKKTIRKNELGIVEETEQIDEAGAAKLARMGYAYDRARIGSRGVNNPERKQQMGDAYYKQREKVEANKAKRVAAGTFDKERELEALHKKYEIRRAKNTVKEELVGGQKRLDVNKNKKLDVNKNKRLDAQDFALLRNKKKTVKEETVEEGKKFKAWTPRLDKLMANRDAVRSKPKKSILTQKVEGGKKIGAARPIAAFKEDVTTEFTTGLPVMEPALGSNIADQSGKGTKRIKKTVKEAATKKPVKKPSPHTGAANVIGKQKAIKDMLNKHGMRW
jgi:hypothetical protein